MPASVRRTRGTPPRLWPGLAVATFAHACAGRPPERPPAEPSSTVAPTPTPTRAEATARDSRRPDAPSRPWPPAPPGVVTSWCIDGLMDALAEDACYVLPDAPTDTLLIYLPGLVPPGRDTHEQRNVESVVARAARRAGVAALLPRGVPRGELGEPVSDLKGFRAYLSWPTGDVSYRNHARRHIERIVARRRALEALVGRPFGRVFLAGSSAGAYFVTHLMLRGDFPADGYAVISGGSPRPALRLADLPKRPLYVGFGSGDSAESANAIAAQALGAGWSVRVARHQIGHGAREVYLDEALQFFGVRRE